MIVHNCKFLSLISNSVCSPTQHFLFWRFLQEEAEQKEREAKELSERLKKAEEGECVRKKAHSLCLLLKTPHTLPHLTHQTNVFPF